MVDCAVIFDVDGVLLALTRAEEEIFFEPFEERYGLTGLSRDWNSYAVRNDLWIIDEIFARHHLPEDEKAIVLQDYLGRLQHRLAQGIVLAPAIEGAASLLARLNPHALVGIATANVLKAARLRLERAGLWAPVSNFAFGAEAGGHKADIVDCAIGHLGLALSNIVYIGDNVNDVVAGQKNGVHFIGFSEDPARLHSLAEAGAKNLADNHELTMHYIEECLPGLYRNTI